MASPTPPAEFAAESKDGLAEAIYQQSKVGIRACENEIVRIGLNWMLQDYRARGENSLLASALRTLQRPRHIASSQGHLQTPLRLSPIAL